MKQKEIARIAAVINSLIRDQAHCFDDERDCEAIMKRFATVLLTKEETHADFWKRCLENTRFARHASDEVNRKKTSQKLFRFRSDLFIESESMVEAEETFAGETSHFVLNAEVEQVCSICLKPEDADGRCGCTNEDSN